MLNVWVERTNGLLHILVVPIAHVAEDVLVVVANHGGYTMSGTFVLVLVYCKKAVRITAFVHQNWRTTSSTVPRRILAVFVAVGAICIPNTRAVVLVSIRAARVPNGFWVVLRGVKVAKEHVVVFAAVDGQNLCAKRQRKNAEKEGKD